MRLGDQRACKRDTTLHPAGEFRRPFIDGIFEPDEAEDFADFAVDFFFVDAFLVEPEPHVFAYGERVEQRGFLKHHSDLLPDVSELLFVQLRDVFAINKDRSFIRLVQPHDQFENRGFSGAAGADDDFGRALEHSE